ncbi:hypothetical protein TSAR_001913 [Trichomalopsis sarcophagae]|uniref:E3 ubiquitin-protein ligase E3D n=1 Tax=Trichomalopsis sarcophagae TaxID=543379 RepID=A0A232EUK6_9HYME|nr:hypothetical protein TSAR_001913 [Trichomalopsis sarcophagae]
MLKNTVDAVQKLKKINILVGAMTRCFSTKPSILTSDFNIQILEDAIEIHIEAKVFKLPLSHVKLLPSSLSSLGITNRWISFRILTQPNSLYGTFETEIINTENSLTSSFSSYSNKVEFPPKNTACKFYCKCCKNVITKTVCFQRILPLPSSDCDPQEWFCCKHSGEESFSLDPKETDLFYSINYSVLNKHVFVENLKFKNSIIHCNRCLSILGSFDGHETKSLKIWNCCVEYKGSNDSISKRISSPLCDFLSSVKTTAELIIGEKILLEAQDVNSLHYILLRPMEAKLDLFTEDKEHFDGQILDLKSSSVVKVLYNYGENKKTIKNNDPDTKHCELALPSILAGMDQLVSSSTRFPPAYRRTDEFYIGYLII